MAIKPVGKVIQLDDTVFASVARPSRRGLYMQTIDDWYTISDSKTDVDEQPQDDGAFNVGRILRASKVMSFGGFAATDTIAEGLRLKQNLAALGADEQVLMTVTDDISTTSRLVEVKSWDIPEVKDPSGFQFTVDVVARDPLRYAKAISLSTGLPVPGGGIRWPLRWPLRWGTGGTSGRITVVNTGTAAARNIMTVAGGGASEGYSLTAIGSGRSLVLDYPVPDNGIVTFNSRTGRVWLTTDAGSGDITRYLDQDDWFTIPKRDQETIQFLAHGDVSGEPVLTIDHRAPYR